MLKIRLTVPQKKAAEYLKNITSLSQNRICFSIADKLTHLNELFYNDDIPEECNFPGHLFTVSRHKAVTAMITHLGLISRYAKEHPDITYIVQLNGNTVLTADEPIAKTLHSVRDVVQFKKETNCTIAGVSYTIFLGSEHEPSMLAAAAQHIMHAHEHGLVAILTVYPRISQSHESDSSVIAGGCGIANALGADIVISPVPSGKTSAQRAANFKQAIRAAGNTKVVGFDMVKRENEEFLQEVSALISISGLSGIAVDHALFQQSKKDFAQFCDKIAKALL